MGINVSNFTNKMESFITRVKLRNERSGTLNRGASFILLELGRKEGQDKKTPTRMHHTTNKTNNKNERRMNENCNMHLNISFRFYQFSILFSNVTKQPSAIRHINTQPNTTFY
jgi:hypothetical protein